MSGDMAIRFMLLAMIPAVFSGAFVLTHLKSPRIRGGIAIILSFLLIAPVLFVLWGGGQPVLSEDAYRELNSLAPHIHDPERTLIVTGHGLEWWTAWILHTHIAQVKALKSDHWNSYTDILYLRKKTGRHFPGLRPPPPSIMKAPLTRTHSRPDKTSPLGVFMEVRIPPDAEILAEGVNFTLARIKTPPLNTQ
jgi:hypothetical protein